MGLESSPSTKPWPLYSASDVHHDSTSTQRTPCASSGHIYTSASAQTKLHFINHNYYNYRNDYRTINIAYRRQHIRTFRSRRHHQRHRHPRSTHTRQSRSAPPCHIRRCSRNHCDTWSVGPIHRPVRQRYNNHRLRHQPCRRGSSMPSHKYRDSHRMRHTRPHHRSSRSTACPVVCIPRPYSRHISPRPHRPLLTQAKAGRQQMRIPTPAARDSDAPLGDVR